MKRFMVVALVAALLVGVVSVSVGCGGDTAKAQEYMNAADEAYQKLGEDANQLAGKITQAMTKATDVAGLEAAIAEVNTFIDDLIKQAEEVTALYDKIKPLNGVVNYVKYADMMTEVLTKETDAFEQLKGAMDAILAAAKAGDTAKLEQLSGELEATFSTIGDEISKLEEQAQKFKTDNNL